MRVRDILLVLALVALTFLLVDAMQPITLSCYSHGEPNCDNAVAMAPLYEGARAQRSLMSPIIASAFVGIAASLYLRQAQERQLWIPAAVLIAWVVFALVAMAPRGA